MRVGDGTLQISLTESEHTDLDDCPAVDTQKQPSHVQKFQTAVMQTEVKKTPGNHAKLILSSPTEIHESKENLAMNHQKT